MPVRAPKMAAGSALDQAPYYPLLLGPSKLLSIFTLANRFVRPIFDGTLIEAVSEGVFEVTRTPLAADGR